MQCRDIRARLGLHAYAVNPDCSTVNGFILSMGGRILADGATCYDAPEALRVFELYETLAREGLAYRIAGGFDDQAAVSQGEAAFSFRSSAGRVQMAEAMAARADSWGIAPIPQADPERPATVLYGPNFILFDTTPEQRDSAWRFVRYFTSPEVQVRWALGSGYVPVRISALEHPRIRAFRAQAPQNRTAFDCIAWARAEPNVAGWQRVRDIVERALGDIMARRLDAHTAAHRIKQEADAVLAAAH
jgi:ABC-type glycerol-3-phosphate transport system substrate-binding protein